MNKLLKYINFSRPQASDDSLLSHISKIIQQSSNNSGPEYYLNKEDELNSVNPQEVSKMLKFLRILKLLEFEEEINLMKQEESTASFNKSNLFESIEDTEKEINENIEILIEKMSEFKQIIRKEFVKESDSENLKNFKLALDEINLNLKKSIELINKNNNVSNNEELPSSQSLQDTSSNKIKFDLFHQISEDFSDHPNECSKSVVGVKFLQNNKIELFTDLRYMCDFESNGHIVISDGYPGQCLIIYDRLNFNYIKTVNLNGRMGRVAGVCAVNDEKLLCVVDWTNSCLYLLDSNYTLIMDKNLIKVKNHRKKWYEAITYNPKEGKFYLISRESCSIIVFDKALNELSDIQLCTAQASFESIKYYNEKFFICDSENKCVYVYKGDFKEKLTFGSLNLDCPTDVIIPTSGKFANNYVLVLEFGRRNLKIFDLLNNYQFTACVNIETSFSNNGLLIDNILIINSDSKELHVYEIDVV